MAGIGFELKKLFKPNSIIMKLRGASYASITTIGPMIMIIGTLFLIYYFLGYNNVFMATRELLASSLLYVFIFSLITTAPFNAVLSRYISDKIFEEQEQDILPSFYAGLTVNLIFSALPGIPFCVRLHFAGGIDPLYCLILYGAYMGLVIVFFSMLYITALKEYLKIVFAYIVGMGITFGSSLLQHLVLGVDIEYAILSSFALGFAIIAAILYGLVRAFFKENSRKYSEVFRYFKTYWRLVVINTLYILGLYVHNFIFWTTDMRIVVANSFVSAPSYDMATCIAMFLNISVMVIFVVEVETRFHDVYQDYCQAVLGSTGSEITYCKRQLFASIGKQILFVFQMQTVIMVSLYLICLVVLPRIGISTYIINITCSLAVAYMMIFTMYNLIIFIYYFNVYNLAMLTSGIFFGVTFLGTLWSSTLSTPSLFGLGPLMGAFCGFACAYLSLYHIEKNLDYYMFCTGSVTVEMVKKDWSVKEYDRTEWVMARSQPNKLDT